MEFTFNSTYENSKFHQSNSNSKYNSKKWEEFWNFQCLNSIPSNLWPRQVGNQMGLLYNMSHISAPASMMKSYFIPLPSHTCVKNVSLSLGEILCRDLKITSLSSFFPSTFFLESRAIQKLSRNHGMSGVSVKADIAKGVKSVEPPTAHRAFWIITYSFVFFQCKMGKWKVIIL